MACVSADDQEGVWREIRETPPAHYLFKVESFSLLSENGVDHIKSQSFRAGEHQWKIIMYPKGNNGGKDDHVSIYLMLESTSSLPAGKGINAFFKFFLFDQIGGKYLTVEGRVRCFDRVKCEWGFAKFIPLKQLKEPTHGFLVNDTSLFGVEVFLVNVTECTALGECVLISKVANISGKYKWVINQFSELGDESYSDEFVVGGYTWKLSLYPNGCSKFKGFSLSLYLESVDSVSCTTEHKVKAEFMPTLNDQFDKNHIQRKNTVWFGSSTQSWGWHNFIELKDLKDGKNGYIVEDQCIIEAEVTVLCETSQKTLNC